MPPPSLFHYASLKSDEQKEWAKKTLVEHKIYFRSREQLNDPNDLRPGIIFEGTDEELRAFVRGLFARFSIRLSPAKRLIEMKRLMHQYRNRSQDVETVLHDALDNVGVFCLSEAPTVHDLWAYYADGFRGIAFEFDSNVGLFNAAQPVRYAHEAPVINRLRDSRSEFLDKSMFTKGTRWAAECEWRIIARWRDERRIEAYLEQHQIPPELQEFMRQQNGPGYYAFPLRAIRSIILGSRISDEDVEWLKDVLRERDGTVPLRRSALSRTNEVTVEELPA